MTLLLSLHDLSKSFGSQKLFHLLNFSVKEGEKIGLVGPNGAGKSTLLKIIYGLEKPDFGHLSKKQGIKISYAEQSPAFTEKSIEQVLVKELPSIPEEEALWKAAASWSKAESQHDLLSCPALLSGGWRKRLDIVRAWVKQPDLVLMDEPTNHLDLEGIDWLEDFLRRQKTACLIVSHDRSFLDHVCTKVLEINPCFPGGLFMVEGGWNVFLERKEAFLEGQRERERSLAGVVREETDWLRRSPKARTTKSKSRVDQAHEFIEELSDVRQRNKKQQAEIRFTASERETRNLVVGTNLSKKVEEKTLFEGVDVKLSPGTRLGIVGKNGTGKTTLLRILAGEVTQDLGTVKYAEDISLVYFDQHREALDGESTLKEALSPHGDFVKFQGQEIHVNGWARRFLFPPEKLNLPVKCLSGGEKARIFIARLMLKPADVLFLDEPTNDLDIPTLEVLEESLRSFPGAIILITHDRYLMDRVCTKILALGEGEAKIFADYAQWEKSPKKQTEKVVLKQDSVPLKPLVEGSVKKKLSYLEQKELDGMENSILSLEERIADLDLQIRNAASKDQLKLYENLGALQQELEKLYERWQYLLTLSKK